MLAAREVTEGADAAVKGRQGCGMACSHPAIAGKSSVPGQSADPETEVEYDNAVTPDRGEQIIVEGFGSCGARRREKIHSARKEAEVLPCAVHRPPLISIGAR
jgi:hypothetical protein